MRRQLATIQKIADKCEIPGADAIEYVRVADWWCVAKKGEFKKGAKCVFFEIDSLLPVDNPLFEFMAKGNKPKVQDVDGVTYTGYRLKTIKLRGYLSQGLALPLTSFADYNIASKRIGTDVSEQLGIVKYDPPLPMSHLGQAKGNFPSFLPKTDEERVQNLGPVLVREKGTKMYVTEKLDGMSTTFYKYNGEFGVCSRNMELAESEDSLLWQVATLLEIKERLPDGYAIQGETVGEGIQKNPLKLHGRAFYAYNVFDIKRQEYIGVDDMIMFLNGLAIPMVPRVADEWELHGTVDDILTIAEGFSRVTPQAQREGLVFRPVVEKTVRMRNQDGRFSFKAISNAYLLKNEE